MSYLLSLGAAVLFGILAFSIWRAIRSARTPQGAAGWAVFLISAPWFALPAFLVFGGHKLPGYHRTRKQSRSTVEKIDGLSRLYAATSRADGPFATFEKLARLPMLGGNDIDLLIDGEETFDAIFSAIDAAQDYVCVQYYTLRDDKVGQALATRLKNAARRGVAVRVMYDGAGSYGLSRSFTQGLRDAGAKVLDPRRARGPTSRININFRNHRKTVIVDGATGFTGGLNMAQTYLDGGRDFDAWRDTHIRLRGPVVAQLQMAFAEDWHWASGELLDDALNWEPAAQDADLPGLVLSSGPADRLDTGALFFMAAISGARQRIWIASPYFVPDAPCLSALTNAALRGCDVRIIMPDAADHYLTWTAAYGFFDEIVETGVRIYRYEKGFMHQKALVIDNDIAGVGTMNFDYRSFRLNFETMALIHDARFAERVAAMLEQDMQNCYLLDKPLSDHPLWLRAAAPVARLFAPVL